MRNGGQILLGVAVWLAGASAQAAQDEVRDAVVKITATLRLPNLVQPWTKLPPQEVSGSGFIIEGHRLLTNAHVVQYASQIYVQPHQSAEKLSAKVLAIAPAVDLALLSVGDESFFDNRPVISLAEGLPQVKSTVNVYGYPVGGEQMSVTEGIISRIDYAAYNFQTAGLRIQIDAALNPGNSGGPAVSAGKLVGVAFSGLKTAENIGYLIPVEEIRLFFDDVADGRYDGKPQLHDDLQTVENDALRAKLGLPKDIGGAMVTRRHSKDESYPLNEGDVITHIADAALDNAARVQVSDDLKLPFQYLIPKVAQDKRLKLKIFRGGQTLDVEVPLEEQGKPLVPYLNGAYPRYFIYGPLVFSPVTREFVQMMGYGYYSLVERGSPLALRAADKAAFEGEELVVVPSPMFAHSLIKGYSQPQLGVVSHVNGTAVRSLVHLVELLRDADGEYIEFKFFGHTTETLVFRRAEIAAATEDILTDNGIRKQCSDDLQAVWDGKQP